MPGVLRTVFRRTAPFLRGHTITQTANIRSKPAKAPINAAETSIGLGMLALAILGPSGWILAHLEDYKKKD